MGGVIAVERLAAKAWTRFDVGVDWKTIVGGTALTLRARVDNVFDKSYWASVGEEWVGQD